MNSVDLETALAAPGLRLLVTASIPSPWSQAALAIMHVKQLPFLLVRTRAFDPAFQRWNGARNMPAVLMNDEPVRTGWAEILALAERLAPEVPLIPADAQERVRVMGLCHEIMSEGALLWCTRLMAIDAGLATEGRDGFPLRSAKYLAPRYGWAPTAVAPARTRALQALALLDAELARTAGPFFTGTMMTALDLYCATAMNALVPLPDADCSMEPSLRAAFAWMGRTLGDAIAPALLKHRDTVVARYFELPIQL